MLPHLLRIFERLPAATSFDDLDVQPDWFAQKLRDAIRAKLTYDWPAPGMDLALFKQYAPHIRIEVVDQKVRAGLDTSALFVYVDPKWISHVAELIQARALDPQPNFVTHLNNDDATRLTSQFDISVSHADGGVVILR